MSSGQLLDAFSEHKIPTFRKSYGAVLKIAEELKEENPGKITFKSYFIYKYCSLKSNEKSTH